MPRNDWLKKYFLPLLILTASMSFITSYYHHYTYIGATNQHLVAIDHMEVVSAKAPAPMQYRAAPYFIAQGILNITVKFGISNDSASLAIVYTAIRFLVMTVAGLALLYFLGLWFDLKSSVMGLLFMFAVNPLAEYQYYHQPGDPWNLLFFILGFIFIAKKYDLLLIPLIFIAVPFRETVLLLIPAYIAARYDEDKPLTVILISIALIIAWLVPWYSLRVIFGNATNYMEQKLDDANLPGVFAENISGTKGWAVLLLYFNILWIAIFAAWNRIPRVIRRIFVIVPLFLLIHLVWGRLVEGRLYAPILPLFLVAGLAWLSPKISSNE